METVFGFIAPESTHVTSTQAIAIPEPTFHNVFPIFEVNSIVFHNVAVFEAAHNPFAPTIPMAI